LNIAILLSSLAAALAVPAVLAVLAALVTSGCREGGTMPPDWAPGCRLNIIGRDKLTTAVENVPPRARSCGRRVPITPVLCHDAHPVCSI
jgi:hypothetical protein